MSKDAIAIVDDWEADLRETQRTVEHCLRSLGLSMDVVLFRSGEAFLEQYRPGAYQILILDIFMKRITGMDVAKRVRAEGDPCKILFLTTSDDFAVESYDVGASYYLLKPLSEEKLLRGLTICLKGLEQDRKFLRVVSGRMTVEIPYSSIYYGEAYRNAIELHLESGTVKTYMTFQYLWEILREDPRFLNCNKGYLVNMDYIERVEEQEFILKNQAAIPIRKRNGSQMKQAYLQYVCGGMKDGGRA